MFFGRKEDFQRLNLETPKPATPAPPPETSHPQPIVLPTPDPATLEAIKHKAKQILDAGRIPEWLFVCRVNGGFVMINAVGPDGPVMLLFSNPHAANDYLRVTRLEGTVGQFRIESLSELVRDLLARGVRKVAFDRCPRCPQYITVDLESLARWTKEDFAKIWAHHHATRLVCGETRVRSSMNHFSANNPGAARSDLEYIRDHFDCGIPYLHQMIGLAASTQGDEAAKAACVERLKEFGPSFDGPLDFSPQLLSTAMVGLMMNFYMLRLDQNAAGAGSDQHSDKATGQE